jgi:hypothetical protein
MSQKKGNVSTNSGDLLRDLKSLIEIVAPLVRQLKAPSPLSTGLSDLPMMAFWLHCLSPHSPALRFGLCWYRVGLSALNYRIDQSAPKGRFDTSIVRQGYDYDHRHTVFQGLKDGWIFPVVTAANLSMNLGI